jgi:glycosyltransferase involved in cell wall biosynthesis
VPVEKITVSRQGLGLYSDCSALPAAQTHTPGSSLRIIFLGRLHPSKGAHVLIEVLKNAPGIPMELDIYGIVQGEADAVYLRRLKRIAGSDGRIRFLSSIPAKDVVPAMREYDVLAVPSQCLETGPMVVMEAFKAGLPVIGSNLGGIAELVTHEVDGLLIDPRALDAWRRALERLYRDRALLSKLRQGIREPRSMADVAADMSRLYLNLLGKDALSSDTKPRSRPRSCESMEECHRTSGVGTDRPIVAT